MYLDDDADSGAPSKSASCKADDHPKGRFQHEILVESSIKFSIDGSFKLVFQTENKNPAGPQEYGPEKMLNRGWVSFAKDIRAYFQVRIETIISTDKLHTTVYISSSPPGSEGRVDSRETKLNIHEYHSMCQAVFKTSLLQGYYSQAEIFPPTIKAFNQILNIHGAIEYKLRPDSKYQDVASGVYFIRSSCFCKQQGPSYWFQHHNFARCFGHHFCRTHGVVSTGFYPLLFSIVPESDFKCTKLSHIYVKHVTTFLTIIASNPLLKAELEQGRTFVNCEQVTQMEKAAEFLCTSGFHKLARHEEIYPPADPPPASGSFIEDKGAFRLHRITNLASAKPPAEFLLPTQPAFYSKPYRHKMEYDEASSSNSSPAGGNATRIHSMQSPDTISDSDSGVYELHHQPAQFIAHPMQSFPAGTLSESFVQPQLQYNGHLFSPIPSLNSTAFNQFGPTNVPFQTEVQVTAAPNGFIISPYWLPPSVSDLAGQY